ncbi:MFS transporter [Advenella kashmirensis W13003]|uniref:MFS transporter n=1 Tax=Advenella kashmirensis W13003 TaxID=1424334 RepID=V8QTK3_9BURK|nr:MFS transporter [Advenella kashmirensis]ETF02640.1 MFS transporter [Advenella kashmirensis W13003]
MSGSVDGSSRTRPQLQQSNPSSRPKRRWSRLTLDLDPLVQSPGFRSLYLARSVSLLSIAILAVAVAWQVYAISGSSLHVAGVSIGLALGSLVGLVWGGALADRADRRRTMIWGRTAYVGVVVLLCANSLRAEPGLVEIYLATLLSGLTSGISAPALMAAMPRLVPAHQLAAAGALNALTMELSRLIGPLIAGALLARLGLASCFIVVLIGAAIVPVLLTRLPQDLLVPDAGRQAVAARPAMHKQWLDGLQYVRHNTVIACLLALDLAMMVFASVHALMPQLAKEVLQGGPQMVGYLYAAPACGALLVALTSGWTRDLARPGRLVIACALLWGVAIAFAGIAAGGVSDALPWGVWPLLVCLAIAGMADTASDIVRGALLQIHTPDALRGRVSGLWLLQGYLGPALGGLQSGALATLWSPGRALVIGGTACALVVGVFTALPVSRLRRSLWSDDTRGSPGQH